MDTRILNEGKAYLEDWGFASEQVKTVYKSLDRGVARDICRFTTEIKAYAIGLATLGRSRLEALFMGQVSHDVLESSWDKPVWMIHDSVLENIIFICMHTSDNALNGGRHAARVLTVLVCLLIFFSSYKHVSRIFLNVLFVAENAFVHEIAEPQKMDEEKKSKKWLKIIIKMY